MIKASLTALVLLSFAGSRLSDVVLSGTAQNCMAGFPVRIIQVPRVTVSVFDPTTNSEMRDSLRAMDAITFSDTDTLPLHRFGVAYDRVMQLASSSTPLVVTTTDSTGAFAFTVPAMDSVLALATIDDEEDEPYPYSYKMVGAQTNGSFVLDLSRGQCTSH